jgi:DNA transformation protein
MALGQGDIAFALDLFDGLGTLTTRRMFGGLCLYCDGTVFAILRSDGALLIKAAGAFRDRVEAEGWEQWTYTRKTGTASAMPYWHLPDTVRDTPEDAQAIARAALDCL